MLYLRLASACVIITLITATEVSQCPGRSFSNLADNVKLTPCKKLPCRLKKGTTQHIAINFTPEKDVADVKNSVQALVLGLKVPFIGVDNKSVCDKIFSESGEQTGCPLKAGATYTYKDSFPVNDFYPSIDTRVFWSLQNKGHVLACFEVPAKIVS